MRILIAAILLCIGCAKSETAKTIAVAESPDNCETPPAAAADCSASVMKGAWMSPHLLMGGMPTSPLDGFSVDTNCQVVFQASSPTRTAVGWINKRSSTTGTVCMKITSSSASFIPMADHVCSYTVTAESATQAHNIVFSCSGTDYGEYWNFDSFHN